MLPRSAGFVVKWGQHRVQAVGLLLVATGLLVLTRLTPTSNYLVVAVGLALMGIGVACTTAPATNAIIGSVPLAKSGVGSAVNDTTREVGGALGIAVLGSVMSSAFRSSMADKVTNLPAELAPIAQDSVGGSFEASKALGAAGQALRDTASLAFTDAMHVTLYMGAGVAVLAAAMVYFLFPRGDAPAWGGGHEAAVEADGPVA